MRWTDEQWTSPADSSRADLARRPVARTLRIDRGDTLRGARFVFGFSRSYGTFIVPDAVGPVNVGNGVVEY
jgi:hypothetical protein